MAIYHLSVKPVSRSAGRSATAAAAYRAGAGITDERTGQTHDYTRKGGVESAALVLPDGAPEWASDRSALWNAAERAEKRKDACVAREYEVALPSELPPEERRRLAADFAREMANREGCAVDVCIHAPGRGGDGRNHHAHLLRTTRKVGAEGLGAKLDTEKAGRNRKQDLEAVRERWAELVNERLRRHGIDGQIDHRSLEAQGIGREPSRHLGPAVSGLVRRGASSDVARRMAEEADARLSAARETGRIERELDRSILDLSGDLAGAIRTREERQREAEAKAAARRQYEQWKAEQAARLKDRQEAERPPRGSTERTGPAVQSSRFKAKPTEERQAAAEQAKPVRPDFEAMPIETQAKALDRLANTIAQHYTARIDRIARKATARRDRRAEAERKLRETEPKPPTGLLASFKRQGYETALGQWRKGQRKAERLREQAEKTRGNIAKLAHGNAPHTWARRVLERAEPDLTRRVDAHRAAEREKQREEQARAELAREFRGLATSRAMKAHGFTDGSKKWQATPEPLRAIIDDYNRRPKEQQERALAAWMRDPEQSKAIATLIEQRRENSRDQGMSR